MGLRYYSGEEVVQGDQVRYGGDSGVVEFVVDPVLPNAETAWYAEEFVQGAMISRLLSTGSIFISDPETDPDLYFIGRAQG